MTKKSSTQALETKQPEISDEPIPTDVGGWAWFQGLADAAYKTTEKDSGLSKQDIDHHIFKCLNSPSGKIMLAHLLTMRDRYKDFDPELGFYNGAAFGFWRSGQRSIIQYLAILSQGVK